MSKKQYFLLFDTETTEENTVADFGGVIVDRKGNIHKEIAVLIRSEFCNKKLFHQPDSNLWNLENRTQQYQTMLEQGTRMLASVPAVNRWLERARINYNPIVTAYNISFDIDKCQKTGIDIDMFADRFCLWFAAAEKWAGKKDYKEFVLNSHAFNAPTDLGNMTYKTNAEIMARYILQDAGLPNEPHTSLEDVKGYELPILLKLVNSKKWQKYKSALGYDWRNFQVRDNFKA